jgi:peroxiredoxin
MTNEIKPEECKRLKETKIIRVERDGKELEIIFFPKWLCPICGQELLDANYSLVRAARSTTSLGICPDCRILFGRYN